MKNQEPICIFIDETGTVSNAALKEDYGFGWVFAPESEVLKAETVLKNHSLDKIHMKKMRGSLNRKMKLAAKLGSSELTSNCIRGGALIRKNPQFAEEIVNRHINLMAINHPELLLKQPEALLSDPGKLVTPEELIPFRSKEMKSKIRIQEIALMATRYPLFAAIKMYGHAEIKINFSAVISVNFSGTAIGTIKNVILSGLNELMTEMKNMEILQLPDNIDPKDIVINVEQKANGLYGLADFFADVGRNICSDNPEMQALGIKMHSNSIGIFQDQFLGKPLEVSQGIFKRT